MNPSQSKRRLTMCHIIKSEKYLMRQSAGFEPMPVWLLQKKHFAVCLKMAHCRTLFRYFHSFTNINTSLQKQNQKWSTQYLVPGFKPLDRMSPPIITRSRLPPVKLLTACIQNTKSCHNQSDSRKKISLQRLFVAKSVHINALLLTLNEFLELSSKWSIL